LSEASSFGDRKELTNQSRGTVYGDEDLAERRVTSGGIRRGNRDLSLRPQAGKRRTKFVRGKGGKSHVRAGGRSQPSRTVH